MSLLTIFEVSSIFKVAKKIGLSLKFKRTSSQAKVEGPKIRCRGKMAVS